MRFLGSRAVLLASAALLAAASGMLWAFYPSGFGAGSVPLQVLPQASQDADGELSFAETDIDLGIVNAPIKHDVEFTNHSDRVVRIGKIRTSCNCTTTQPDRLVLQPGEKGSVRLNIEPHLDHIGQSRHAITVEYEGAEPRQVRLEAHYLTKPDVVAPEEVAIRRAGDQEASATFTLVDYRDTPLKIASISSSTKDLSARVAQAPSAYLPGWQYRIEADLSGVSRSPGDYAETLTLHTDDVERQSIIVRVAVHQVSRLRIAPAVLHLKPTPDAAEAIATVFVDDVEGAMVEIEAATPSDGRMRCAFGGDSSRQTVEVRVRKEDLSGLSRPASVRLTLTKPSSEVLCVPVVP